MLKKIFFTIFANVIGTLDEKERLAIRARLDRAEGKAKWVLTHTELSTDGKTASVKFRKDL